MRVGGGKEKEDSCNEGRVGVGETGGWKGKGSEEEMEQESYARQISKKFHS